MEGVQTNCLVGSGSRLRGTVPKSGSMVQFDHCLQGDIQKWSGVSCPVHFWGTRRSETQICFHDQRWHGLGHHSWRRSGEQRVVIVLEMWWYCELGWKVAAWRDDCQGLFYLKLYSKPKSYQPIPMSNPHLHYIRLHWGCSSKQLYSSSDAVGAPPLDLWG